MFKRAFAFNIFVLTNVQGGNWAQLAGMKTQNSNAAFSEAKFWSPRWGHAVLIVNQTAGYRNDLTAEDNSIRVQNLQPRLVLLGGDDYNSHHCRNECSKSDEISIGGLKNDVWSSTVSSKTSSIWKARKVFDRFRFNADFNYVESTMSWEQVSPGYEAPPIWPETHERAGEDLTYFEWIQCQDYFNDIRTKLIDCEEETWIEFKRKNMWTPRRGHAVASINGSLIVIGGRSRENEFIDHYDLKGDFSTNHSSGNSKHVISTLTNDIWISFDGSGEVWELVTVGCQDHQEDMILHSEKWYQGNPKREVLGTKSCTSSADCFGDAICKTIGSSLGKTCVCPMFSMREHHSVSVQHRTFTRHDGSLYSEDYIYVVGGSTSIRKSFCSNHSCGSYGTYKQSLSDIWVASIRDLKKWVQVRPSISSEEDHYQSRSGHGAVFIHANPLRNRYVDQLWILGGRFTSPDLPQSVDLNDVWKLSLSSRPCCTVDHSCDRHHRSIDLYIESNCLPQISDMIMDDRQVKWQGRSGFVTIYEPPSSSNKYLDVILIIGGKYNDEFQSDVWSLQLEPNSEWKRDFSETDVNVSKISSHQIEEPTKVGHRLHFDKESNLSHLSRQYLPVTEKMESDVYYTASIINFFNQHELEILKNLGIVTFKDFVNASLQRMLNLRGYDYPHVTPMPIKNICYARTLVESFLLKCSRPTTQSGESNLNECKINDKERNIYDDQCVSQKWNGCDPIPGYKYLDIHGIGIVEVPYETNDVSSDLENMHCKSAMDGRYMAAGAYIDGKPLVLGGRGSDMSLYQDVWARDVYNPVAVIDQKPLSFTPQSKFTFQSSKDGVFRFEYKLFDLTERLDVTPWMISTYGETADVSWLDTKEGGPGSGWYTIYVRAVDPSGNRDESYSTSTNVYTWYYSQPLPYSKIFLSIFAAILLIITIYIEYRRRERQQMIESYRNRKMRRKFKLNSMSEGLLGYGKHGYASSTPSVLINDLKTETTYSYLSTRRNRRKIQKQIIDRSLSSDEEEEMRRKPSRKRNPTRYFKVVKPNT